MSDPRPTGTGEPTCSVCGAPAACYGDYGNGPGYCCNTCCAHGCEDGECRLLEDFDDWWLELREIADADPDGDCAGPDKESFREMWEEGQAPEDTYNTVWEDARR